MRRRTDQLDLFAKKRAKRRGKRGIRPASAPAARAKEYLPHVARPEHDERHPVHVTMRRVNVGPSFRSQRVSAAIVAVIAAARRNGVRVIQYSIQGNHLHLMVEGQSSADLSNQMRTLFSRIAFAVNAVARRHGRLFRDRHHRHELTKPSEVRNALVYILFNDRKHHGQEAPGAARGTARMARTPRTARTTRTLDPCSSALWFHDWVPWDRPPAELLRDASESPAAKPETWLARTGWQRGLRGVGTHANGCLRFSEMPRPHL